MASRVNRKTSNPFGSKRGGAMNPKPSNPFGSKRRGALARWFHCTSALAQKKYPDIFLLAWSQQYDILVNRNQNHWPFRLFPPVSTMMYPFFPCVELPSIFSEIIGTAFPLGQVLTHSGGLTCRGGTPHHSLTFLCFNCLLRKSESKRLIKVVIIFCRISQKLHYVLGVW